MPEPVTAGEFRFRVDGPDGAPVTSYAVVHDKPMHLIVVRRDLTGYQHLHPTMDPDGTWRVDLTLDAPGVYRAYADFAVIGATARRPRSRSAPISPSPASTRRVPCPRPHKSPL